MVTSDIAGQEYKPTCINATSLHVGYLTSSLVIMNTGDFPQRVRQALAYAELNHTSAAKKLTEKLGREIKPQTIQYMSSKAKSSELAADLAMLCGVNYEWLAHGFGEMIFYATESSAALEINESRPNLDWDFVDRVIDAHLSAGNGEVIWDFDIVSGSRAFERSWMQKEGLRADRCKLWNVRGDSMWPEFSDGDSVLVNMADRDIVSGNVYALVGDDGLRIKRLYNREGYVEMRSDNPQQHVYPPEQIKDHNYAVIGRVVWKAGKISKKRG